MLQSTFQTLHTLAVPSKLVQVLTPIPTRTNIFKSNYLVGMRVLIGSLTALLLATQSVVQAFNAPGVDPVNGVRPSRIPERADSPALPPPRSVPAEWRQAALSIIARFESGSPNVEEAYGNVSETDVLSLGFLQWNHNAQSLYRVLLKDAGQEFVDAAPLNIRDGVARIIQKTARDQEAVGLSVISSWRGSNGKLRPEVVTSLRSWLKSQVMRRQQDRLIDLKIKEALRFADAWQAHWGEDMNDWRARRTFFYFLDVAVFNGNLDGLWVKHVEHLITQHPTSDALLAMISDWTTRCVAFKFAGGQVHPTKGQSYVPKFRSMYRLREAPLSVELWRQLYASGDPRADRSALRLLAMSFLRAVRSNGSDAPRGFHGVFQLDVLNRRGMIVFGTGYPASGSDVTPVPAVLWKIPANN
jgi:hypothetical protein